MIALNPSFRSGPASALVSDAARMSHPCVKTSCMSATVTGYGNLYVPAVHVSQLRRHRFWECLLHRTNLFMSTSANSAPQV